MRVAIYSGEIPSTVFVENLIRGIGNNEGVSVLLFGKMTRPIRYDTDTIMMHPTPRNPLLLAMFVMGHSMRLILSRPGKVAAVWREAFKQRGVGGRMRYLGQMLPVILNAPDIFHVQWTKDLALFVALKTILPKMKIIVSFRGAHINYSPVYDTALAASYREDFPKVDGFHAVCDAIAREALKYGADLSKTAVIRPAVDAKLFDIEAEKKPGLSIVSIGRSHWKKGYMYAVDAMYRLKERGVDFHYTIVSAGDNEELIYQIHELDLGERVSVVSGLPHEEVLKLVKSSALFLLPSVEEGIANVVLESMALGTFVISTDCGGMAEVVDENNGILIPLRDIDAIVGAVERYLGMSPEARELCVVNALETIRRSHLLPQQIEGMYELYRKVYDGK